MSYGGLTRRTFLKGVSAGVAGVAAAGILGGCSNGSGAGASDTEVVRNPVRTETCDVVVVGTGTAGMCAAARAAELGAKVIQLEKNGVIGGTSIMAEGVGGINTKQQASQGITIDVSDVFLAIQEYHHWAAESGVLMKYLSESGATVNWLEDTVGVNFYQATVTAPTSFPTWHLAALADGTPDRNGKTVIEPLRVFGEKLGVDLRTSNPATGLIVKDGAVTGVYANDGKDEYAIEAKGVILATGGYSNNKEMFEAFAHVDFDKIFNWGAKGRDGEGIAWAREAGAALHIPGTVMYSCSRVPKTTVFYEPVNWIFSWQPNLRVNEKGERFINEAFAPDFSRFSNAVLAQTAGFSLFDQGFMDMLANKTVLVGLDIYDYVVGKPMPGAVKAVEDAVTAGRIFKADTLEALAGKLGIDAKGLQATVDEYNTACSTGIDVKFGKPPVFLQAMKTAPFYGSAVFPCAFTTVGGVRVDESLRVLSEEGNPISGLYAIGGDAGSIYGRDYDVGVMSGSQQGWCATGGRLAAEHAVG